MLPPPRSTRHTRPGAGPTQSCGPGPALCSDHDLRCHPAAIAPHRVAAAAAPRPSGGSPPPGSRASGPASRFETPVSAAATSSPTSAPPGASALARCRSSPGTDQRQPAADGPLGSQTSPPPMQRCAAPTATARPYAPPCAGSPDSPSRWPAPAALRRHCRGGSGTATAATPIGHREPCCRTASRRAANSLAASSFAPSRASSTSPWQCAAGPSLLLRAVASLPHPKGLHCRPHTHRLQRWRPSAPLDGPVWLAPRGGPVFV